MTDITYLRTHEGWLNLCPRHCLSDQWRSSGSIIDLSSRLVVGWSAQPRMTTDLALQALLMAVWRREPTDRVMVHSPFRDIAAQYPAGQRIRARSSPAANGNPFSASTDL